MTFVVVALDLHARVDDNLGGVLDIFRSYLIIGAFLILRTSLIEIVLPSEGHDVLGPSLPRLTSHPENVIK
jgi:hypothetical protein